MRNNAVRYLRDIWKTFVGLVFPAFCLVCKKNLAPQDGIKHICPACWAAAVMNRPPFCSCCGRTLDRQSLDAARCKCCREFPLRFDRACSPFVYEGAVKELIHQFKYGRKDYLGKTLAAALIDFIREYALPIGSFDYLVPMPLHAARLREREFNQALVLAQELAQAFGTTVRADVLVRRRNTRTQTDLEGQERFANVSGSFAVRDQAQVRDRRILLIDDVLTTGATASEAAGTLKDAGARTVWVMTLAS